MGDGDVMNTFKMNIQIVNVPRQTLCTIAVSSVVLRHLTVSPTCIVFRDQAEQLQAMKWRHAICNGFLPGNSIHKSAMQYSNCISDPAFSIPISQVSLHEHLYVYP